MAKIEASHDVQSCDLHAGDGELRPEANSGETGAGRRDAPANERETGYFSKWHPQPRWPLLEYDGQLHQNRSAQRYKTSFAVDGDP